MDGIPIFSLSHFPKSLLFGSPPRVKKKHKRKLKHNPVLQRNILLKHHACFRYFFCFLRVQCHKVDEGWLAVELRNVQSQSNAHPNLGVQ